MSRLLNGNKENVEKIRQANIKVFVRRGGPNYQIGLQKMKDLSTDTKIPFEVYLLYFIYLFCFCFCFCCVWANCIFSPFFMLLCGKEKLEVLHFDHARYGPETHMTKVVKMAIEWINQSTARL